MVDTSAEETDPELEGRLKAIDPGVIYLNPGKNLGYFGGARYGKEWLDREGTGFDALIVSNVDLTFETAGMAEIIRSYGDGETGVLAPAILEDGKDINPYKLERMNRKQQRRRILYLRCPALQKPVDMIRKIRKKQIQENREYPDGMKIYMGYGACMIFLEKYFASGCDLNLPLFLYGEEPYVSEMCLRHGLSIRYAPKIRILNIGHVSMGSIPSRTMRKYMIESAKYCIREFY